MSVKRHGGNLLDRPAPRTLATALLCLSLAPAGQAAVLGLVTDTASRHVAVFDAETDTIAAQLNTSPGNAIGDCAVSPALALGITTNSSSQLSFIELGGLAPKQSALPISNLGVDMTLSPDGDWLVAAGGGALAQPLSVIDTRSRTEVGVSTPFMDHTSVEFCDDATLLVTTSWGRSMGGVMDNALYAATVGADAGVTLTGQRLSSGAQPNNSACAPGSAFGVLLDRAGGLTSFRLPDLAPADTARLFGMGLSAAFSADGDFVSRFQREAKLVAQLRHTNIVGVVDAGEIDGAHYMALELVDGVDLRSLLRARICF